MLRREIGCRRISWMMWIYNELEDRMHGLEAFWDLVGHGPLRMTKAGWLDAVRKGPDAAEEAVG